MIELKKYEAMWSQEYQEIKKAIWPYLGGVAVGIEHIGATSIDGCMARPIIDIDLILASNNFNTDINEIMTELGYTTKADLTLNKPFKYEIKKAPFIHQINIVSIDCLELKGHLNFKNMLLKNNDLVVLYNEVKTSAAKAKKSSDDYTRAKSPMIGEVLKFAGLNAADISGISALYGT